MKKKNKKPLITIIVNCYNGEKYLKDCIKSIIDQSYKKWEVIFWDNLSTDTSKKIFNKFKDKRLKYFKARKHTTLYKARNLAIKKAKGSIITFLDTDDFWHKDKLLLQLRHFTSKNCTVSYTNLNIFKDEDRIINKDYFSNLYSGFITQQLLDNYKIGIITAMVDKNIFKKNKFNSKYQIIGDFDFFLKLSKKNKFCCLEKSLANYRQHNDNFSSKKSDLYVNELFNWIKNNENHNYKSFNFTKLKRYYFLLNVKNLLKKIINMFRIKKN